MANLLGLAVAEAVGVTEILNVIVSLGDPLNVGAVVCFLLK